MRIVAAPDSFKESVSASRAAQAIAEGIADADPGIECFQVPLSDGGEGFIDTVARAWGATPQSVDVRDALGRTRHALIAVKGKVALIEVAQAVGLAQLDEKDRSIMSSATWGVGDLIRAALDEGARELIIGLGGSATSDGGAGMMQALGARLLDASGRELSGSPDSLAELLHVDTSSVDPRLAGVKITIASDVRNHLLGPQGAAAVFGPQKGAAPANIARIDSVVAGFVTAAGKDSYVQLPGAGAAGGLGFALAAFLDAQFRPGIDVSMDVCGFDSAVQGADWVFTGEGSIDGQTMNGKAPWGVAQRAAAFHVPVIGFAGRLAQGWELLLAEGFTALFPISNGARTLPESLAAGESDLRRTAATVTRLLCVVDRPR